jgi:hypothetical protein
MFSESEAEVRDNPARTLQARKGYRWTFYQRIVCHGGTRSGCGIIKLASQCGTGFSSVLHGPQIANAAQLALDGGDGPTQPKGYFLIAIAFHFRHGHGAQ